MNFTLLEFKLKLNGHIIELNKKQLVKAMERQAYEYLHQI